MRKNYTYPILMGPDSSTLLFADPTSLFRWVFMFITNHILMFYYFILLGQNKFCANRKTIKEELRQNKRKYFLHLTRKVDKVK